MTAKVIPLVDLRAQYLAHREELDAALAECVENARFIGGPDHEAFAGEFAEWCGGGHMALVGNGTHALEFTLRELLGPGDGVGEVITVSHTFIATAEAIVNAGYRPVFVDVDAQTGLMNAGALEAAIRPDTRAIVPVHLYGQMAEMDKVMSVARHHGLKVIEDAAQAHGAGWQGKHPGEWGDAACFSFYPGKNLGAWGDGGAVFTRDADLAARIACYADHGREDKYLHDMAATNSRLDGIQAAVLRVKLRHLDAWNEARRTAAAWYDEMLEGEEAVERVAALKDALHARHLYVVQIDGRDRVLAAMKEKGVHAGVHYPIPLHEQPVFSHLGYAPEDLPVTSRAARRVLSLPLYPELTCSDAERVVSTLKEVLSP
ncbi:MAG: DegT/DnrJ/EryC1/StrS family aminotransferase [Alphaproteobacteria bacterium]|jgi:dTDP-4-amino-4,6-dideoxygalactose transaminase|nr:DegT/DnrJ/EryC1/StrS family aminotransferase [Alphaproteobacteria bacterium]MDP6781707.1 DegT/DnrJ/EryC1/StrS family aminotransferase [Alphaproteobacteria bacterium]|tara:strand:- start:607 stop:1728 length:1122 start_codon:yes stop_codon:yes gene_type:complete